MRVVLVLYLAGIVWLAWEMWRAPVRNDDESTHP